MASITRELHDTCIAYRAAFKARDPELFARATARGVWLMDGTPEQALSRDLNALDDVAQAFATGIRPSKKSLKRVEAILVREAAGA